VCVCVVFGGVTELLSRSKYRMKQTAFNPYSARNK